MIRGGVGGGSGGGLTEVWATDGVSFIEPDRDVVVMPRDEFEELFGGFVKWLFQMGWPYDMLVVGDDDEPILPPRPVIDTLVEMYREEDRCRESVDHFRWSFEVELGLSIWSADPVPKGPA